MSYDDDATTYFQVNQLPGSSIGSERHNLDLPVQQTSNARFASITPVEVRVSEGGYQESGFRYRRRHLGLQPMRVMSDAEVRVAKRRFGVHSGNEVYQTRLLESGRESYLMSDGQVIQKSSPGEIEAAGGATTFFLRNSTISSTTARAVVDGFESEGKGFVDFSKLKVFAGSQGYRKEMTTQLRMEEGRRFHVALDKATKWSEHILLDRERALESGRIKLGSHDDQANQAKLKLANHVLEAVSSGSMSSIQMSAIYRQFEPLDPASQPHGPSSVALAQIIGVVGVRSPKPASPNPQATSSRTRPGGPAPKP